MAGIVNDDRRPVVNRAAASAKHLSDGGGDKTERGEPTHSPDQQLHHAAVFPCCQRWRLIRGMEQKEPVSKKSPAVASGLSLIRHRAGRVYP
jgi:hypothetical protein